MIKAVSDTEPQIRMFTEANYVAAIIKFKGIDPSSNPIPRAFDPAFSLVDDVHSPASLGVGLDSEGTPRQRAELVRLRNTGDISNEVMHRLERELDLEDERLEI